MARWVVVLCAAAALLAATSGSARAELWPPSVLSTGVRTATSCLRPAGADRVALTEAQKPNAALVLVDVSPPPPLPPRVSARVRMGALADCPAVASGGGITVAFATADRKGLHRAAVIDSRGSSLQTLRDRGTTVAPVSVAVDARGNALAVWTVKWKVARRERLMIVAAHRPAGGRFGTPRVLTRIRRDDGSAGAVAVVAVADGFLASWAAGTESGHGATVEAAAFDAGGVERARYAVAAAGDVQRLSLAAATDGRAVLAYDDGDSVQYAERGAGGPFSAVRELSDAGDQPGVAMNERGDAVVGWLEGDSAVAVVWRPAGGAFGPVQRFPGRIATGPQGAFAFTQGFAYDIADPARLDVAISGEGRAVAAYLGRRAGADPLPQARALVSDAAGRFARRDTYAGLLQPIRATDQIAVIASERRLRVIWTDFLSAPLREREFPAESGYLRSTTEADQAFFVEPVFAPRGLRVRAPAQRLARRRGPRIHVACAQRCDARVVVSRPGGGRVAALGAVVPGPRGRTIRTYPSDLRTWPPRGVRRLRVAVRATQPGGGREAVVRTTLRVLR